MMKRLTEKITNKETGEILAYRTLPNVGNLKATKQLGRYEDTGLTPEQVQELKERDTAKRLNSCECVSCGNDLLWMKDSGAEFCPWCGQRLDWSE